MAEDPKPLSGATRHFCSECGQEFFESQERCFVCGGTVVSDVTPIEKKAEGEEEERYDEKLLSEAMEEEEALEAAALKEEEEI